MIDNLFTTVIGSHLWAMNKPESDTDYFKIYVASSDDILKGIADTSSKFIQENNEDWAIHEVGKLVNQLVKGNYNFLTGVMSPIVIGKPHEGSLMLLKHIVKENIAKNCFNSIHGLAEGNWNKYIKSGKDNAPRRRYHIQRTLKFGEHLLLTGEFEFAPVFKTTENDIIRAFKALDIALEKSSLPDKPYEKPFRDWLYLMRILEWEKSEK